MTLAVRDVAVAVGSTTVLSSVSFTAGRGEWLAPIGPNGAGKSTLLRAIAGLVVHRGRIELMGVALDRHDRRRLAQTVALVPQRPQLPPAMSVADYVMLGRSPHLGYLGWESASDRRIVAEAMERLELGAFAGRPLGTLSGGEAQRVALARAVAQATPILLLDEPTSALDLGHQQQVLELIDSLRREEGLTVLSTMHDLSLAGQYADRVLLLAKGRLVASGPAQEVMTAELIEAHYGALVEVRVGSAGEVLVTPRRVPPPVSGEVAS